MTSSDAPARNRFVAAEWRNRYAPWGLASCMPARFRAWMTMSVIALLEVKGRYGALTVRKTLSSPMRGRACSMVFV